MPPATQATAAPPLGNGASASAVGARADPAMRWVGPKCSPLLDCETHTPLSVATAASSRVPSGTIRPDVAPASPGKSVRGDPKPAPDSVTAPALLQQARPVSAPPVRS